MTLTVADIIRVTSEKTGFSKAEIISERRKQELAEARFMIVRLARKHTDKSYPQMARLLGDRDHSGLVYGAKRADELLRNDENFRKTYKTIEGSLDASIVTPFAEIRRISVEAMQATAKARMLKYCGYTAA